MVVPRVWGSVRASEGADALRIVVRRFQRCRLLGARHLYVIDALESIEQAYLGVRLQAARRCKAAIDAARLLRIIQDLRYHTQRQRMLLPSRVKLASPFRMRRRAGSTSNDRTPSRFSASA
jgi:hypothetical protein